MRKMPRLSLTKQQSQTYAEKILDLGNLALAGIVFTQLLPGNKFDFRLGTFGFVAFVLAYVAGYYIMKGNKS